MTRESIKRFIKNGTVPSFVATKHHNMTIRTKIFAIASAVAALFASIAAFGQETKPKGELLDKFLSGDDNSFCAELSPENYPSALTPAALLTGKRINTKYLERYRTWQGIPAIEITKGGRMWAAWYGGPVQEGKPGNFIVLSTSADGGKTWSPPVAVYDATLFYGAYTWDPTLWKDKDGNLFFSVTRTMGASKEGKNWTSWIFKAENPENPFTKWSPSFFGGYGVSLNKASFLSNGDILRPVDVRLSDGKTSNVEWYISKDAGKSYAPYSVLMTDGDKEKNGFLCEHMLIERKDGTLWMLVRTRYGIAQADSKDGGKTWENFRPFTDKFGINTRFYLGKLKSGNLILVANDHPKARSNMTVFLSEDEGKTWPYKLAIDERERVSYPDATQAQDGFIYIAYDHGRYEPGEQDILFAKLTEADIKAGKLVNPASALKQMINTLTGTGGGTLKKGESSAKEKTYQEAINAMKHKNK